MHHHLPENTFCARAPPLQPADNSRRCPIGTCSQGDVSRLAFSLPHTSSSWSCPHTATKEQPHSIANQPFDNQQASWGAAPSRAPAMLMTTLKA